MRYLASAILPFSEEVRRAKRFGASRKWQTRLRTLDDYIQR